MLAKSAWAEQTGQWDFDGNHNDSVGANAGTFVGTEAYANGYLGQAISLNGSSYLNLGSGVLSTTAYTKAAWIRRTGSGGNNIISGNNTSGLHAFWASSTYGFRLSSGHNGSWTQVQDNLPIPANVWTHVAVTYNALENGGTLRLYRNGRLTGGTPVATNVLPPTGGAVLIGAHNNGNNFTGQIDDVGLWNSALTADEIQLVYKAGMQSRYAVFAQVPEGADYEVIYELAIPDASSLGSTGNPSYSFDNSEAYGNGLGFDRVAYYLGLSPSTGSSQWVYVSMDPFTLDARRIGVPTVASGGSFQSLLTGMNVYAGNASVTTGTNIQTGNIEFWGYNYGQANAAFVPGASASTFDFGDTINAGGTYGSMQVHNYGAGQTIFAYNRWGTGGNSDLGIGNRAATDTDWTFAQNAASYTNKLLLALVRPADIPNVTFTSVPKPLQLYPRDLATGLATVRVEGSVLSSNCTQIAVSVNRAGVLYTNAAQPLVYTGGSAAFSIGVPIHAELADYDFEIIVTQNGHDFMVATARDVVAGDAFLINGQSNAEAMSRGGSANGNQSVWIRSFGYHSSSASVVQNDLDWHMAEGDAAEGPGSIGQWGLRMARMLIDSNAIPVAILNQAKGGTPISYFQCNDSDPANPSINYGQMLYRVRKAGLADSVRAILWYQGETDKGEADLHERGWLEVYRHWMQDYPSVEKVYVCQLHVATCNVATWTVELRDRQRRWGDTYDNVEVMSTTGLQQHTDTCHYAYDPGYRQLGEQLGRLLRRDFYGASLPSQIVPPNIEAAYLTDSSGTNVTLITRNAQDQLTMGYGMQGDFRLEGNGGITNALAVSATASGNTIQLAFNTSALLATGISYSGHTGGAPFLTNAMGLGLLSFHNQPILAGLAIPDSPTGLQTIPVSSNRIDLAWSASGNASHYLVRRDGATLGTAYETRFVDGGVTAGIHYDYQVAACSPAGTSSWCTVVSGVAPVHNVFAHVPEANDYDLLYLLDLPANNQAGGSFDLTYSVNNAVNYAKPIARVAYYLEVQEQPGMPMRWVYVSMKAFADNPIYLGVPVAAKGQTFQMPVEDMNVYASADSGIATGLHLTTGNIEFWGYNYTTTNAASVPNGNGAIFDCGDQIDMGGTYGSMQIHNHDLDDSGPGTDAQVLLAYNDWGGGGIDDIDIGNASSGPNPDWTFAANAQGWGVKRLYVLARPVTPLQITPTLEGSQLRLSWPPDQLGWRLESQTNAPGAGLGTNWFPFPGSLSANEVTLPLNPTNGNVFFRLVYP